jgi:hypothetical protein
MQSPNTGVGKNLYKDRLKTGLVRAFVIRPKGSKRPIHIGMDVYAVDGGYLQGRLRAGKNTVYIGVIQNIESDGTSIIKIRIPYD